MDFSPRESGFGALRNDITLPLGEGGIDVEHERVGIQAKLGDHERDFVNHQPGNKMHVSAEPIKLGDGYRAGKIAGGFNGEIKNWPHCQRVRARAGFDLLKLMGDCQIVGLGKPGKLIALSVNAQTGTALALC